MKLSIIIPVFNEEKNIGQLYQNILDVLKSINNDYEIIIIDDGSTDNTLSALNKILDEHAKTKVILLRRNFGQTAAMMAGIEHSLGDIIVPMDGDLQNDPKDIPNLIDKIKEGYDVCSGWRKNRKDNSFTRTLPSKIANKLISKISGVHLHDYGCSLKAYKREVLEDVKLYGEMHRFIPIYASWFGAKITEIPVSHHPRIHGQSKYGIQRTFKVILDLLVVKFLSDYSTKPIYIFGGFGLLNFFCSFLSVMFMFYYKFFDNTSFISTPLPLLTIFFFTMGFMSILMGLLAELQIRTYHETQKKPIYIINKILKSE
jgi:glycosyltransferase involved in cell wall biosynthesis